MRRRTVHRVARCLGEWWPHQRSDGRGSVAFRTHRQRPHRPRAYLPLERFDSYEDADTRRYADATETQEIEPLTENSPVVHTAESAPETEHDLEEEDVDTGELNRSAKLASDEDITHETNDDDDLSTNELPRGYSADGPKPAVRTRIVAPPGRPHPLLAGRRPSLSPPPSRKQSESESRLLPAVRR